MSNNLLTPTAQFDPFPHICVQAFGRPLNWSTSLLLTQEDVEKHDLAKRIAEIAYQQEVETVLAPCAQFSNGRICGIADLGNKIGTIHNVGHGTYSPVVVHRGCDADGVTLPIKHAFYVSTGDCLVGVLTDTESRRTVAFHVSRDSLIPESWLDPDSYDEEPKRVLSVVEKAFVALQPEGVVKAFFCCGIDAGHFGHPWDDVEYGERNRKLFGFIAGRYGSDCFEEDRVRDGKLSLHTLMRKQCEDLGISSWHIASDGIDTYSDTDKDGKPVWWSFRRDHGHERNGVFVFRKF